MTTKSLVIHAGVSLVVVLAYEAHKSGKLPKVRA